jgi:hypothetical protein
VNCKENKFARAHYAKSIIKSYFSTVRAMMTLYLNSGDPLKMGYFDNLDNEYLNKYKINLKNEKKIYRCIFLLLD